MIDTTSSIKKFLEHYAPPDLAALYGPHMEIQVNAAQDDGERITGEYNGRPWHGWTDGLGTTWKSFRIPYKANTEPEWTERPMRWDLEAHAESIGMTGWDWVNKRSVWVAFDFDALIDHKVGLSNDELKAVETAAFGIPWVTIRRSTSGKGLHFYVFIADGAIQSPVNTHTEHAALARAILGKLSARAGYDFNARVDNCGGLMWCWHRKLRTYPGALEVIQPGRPLTEVPPNWRDHCGVVKRSTRKRKRGEPGSTSIDDLAQQRHNVSLDEGHRSLINYLDDPENKCLWWWDTDKHMLVTHTIHLRSAHRDLGLAGNFDTVSEPGPDTGYDQNCFLFPLRNGAWSVKRYTRGVEEHSSWTQDGNGWTSCTFNKKPDFRTACRTHNGLEDDKKSFLFTESEQAANALEGMGIKLDDKIHKLNREIELKMTRDGRVLLTIDKQTKDTNADLPGWRPKGKKWLKVATPNNIEPMEPDVLNYDNLIRHIISSSDEDCGWMIASDNTWRLEPLAHVRPFMQSLGFDPKEMTNVIGSSISKAWRIVSKPFQPEYPGNREWNKGAAQLKYAPTSDTDNLTFAHWSKILDHIGKGLDAAVSTDGWCLANNIYTGGEYLTLWIASIFQEPTEPLPYLFLCGDQNTGKSILHEALSLLLTKGYQRADAALVNQSGFNAELVGAIICVVEETDLRIQKAAENRIKDWVTSRDLLIHAKGKTPYHIKNTTHWIQCANDHRECPILPGDTRITMIYVPHLDPLELIPKKRLIEELEREAPDFIAHILNVHIPPSNDRLNVPVLETQDKITAAAISMDSLQAFMSNNCEAADGYSIKFSDFHGRFVDSVDASEKGKWTKKRVGAGIPPPYIKGRRRKDNQVVIGNIRWSGIAYPDDSDNPRTPLLLVEGIVEGCS
jgi:hypothetical protein